MSTRHKNRDKKNILFLSIIFIAAFFLISKAPGATKIGKSKPFGLGLQIGDPSTVTAKLFLNSDTLALQAGVGGGWWSHSVMINFDFVWHPAVITQNEHFELPFFVGVGTLFAFFTNDYWYWEKFHEKNREFAMWIRMPMGVSFMLNKISLEPFVELSPAIMITPAIDFSFFFGLGARYYF